MSLNRWIFIACVAGLLVGILISQLGPDVPGRSVLMYVCALIAGIFVSMLKMILVPLIFTSIIVGVASLQSHHQAGKVWMTTMVYFISTLALAVLIGLIAANIFKPGAGQSLAFFVQGLTEIKVQQLALPEFFLHFLIQLFQNPFAALANGSLLAVVVFALFIGVALVSGGSRFERTLGVLQEFFELMLMLVGWIMRLAPLGIFALLVQLMAEQPLSLLMSVLGFIVLVFAVTLFHGAVVLPGILYAFTRRSPLWFWRGSREALITAFATSSSAATLPITLRVAQENLHIRRDIAGFVVPLGATVNMDGTALYEALAALFVANLVGIELTLAQQLVVFFMAMIASIGAPGIPSAGMVTMVMVLQAVGLPAEAIALLLPIDRLLDTIRTAVNVEGDLVGGLIVQELVGDENQISEDRPRSDVV